MKCLDFSCVEGENKREFKSIKKFQRLKYYSCFNFKFKGKDYLLDIKLREKKT